MRKFLLVLVAMLALSAMPTQAARMFLAQPNHTLALQEEQVYDTVQYAVDHARCAYYPSKNQPHKETGDTMFYMIMSFYATTEQFPQLQFHILTHDTLSITREDNVFFSVRLGEAVEGGNPKMTMGVACDSFRVDFVRFDPSNFGQAVYDCYFNPTMADGRVLVGEFNGVIPFFNAENGMSPFIPTHEQTPEGFEQNEAVVTPVKVLRNGQVLIVREGRMYDLCGRVI